MSDSDNSNSNNGRRVHICAECHRPDTEVVLFNIAIPDMVDDYYCREHILIAVDSDRKNKAKAKQADTSAVGDK